MSQNLMIKQSLAPIAFFVYKRPIHTLNSLVALSKCLLAHSSELYIFCDGPKQSVDIPKVMEVREIVSGFKWSGDVHLILQDKNIGLANSIISGVTDLCNRYGKVIVVEDDLEVAEGFLEYMNNSLSLYSDHFQVLQISGHIHPFMPVSDSAEAFFMPISCTWGWATWKRSWDFFDPNATGWGELIKNKKLKTNFDLGNVYPYAEMLHNQISGKIDSWGIRWWWTFFNKKGLCLYPKYSLVNNCGFDETATHTKKTETYHSDPNWDPSRRISVYPSEVCSEDVNFSLYKKYIKLHTKNPSIMVRGYRLLRRALDKISIPFHKRKIS